MNTTEIILFLVQAILNINNKNKINHPCDISSYYATVIQISKKFTPQFSWCLLRNKGIIVPPPPSSQYNKIHPLAIDHIAIENSKKIVALTFDDGPHPIVTPRILKTLKEKNVAATFFIVGVQAQSAPEILKKTYEAGHDIANHTWSHGNSQFQSIKKQNQEISQTQDFIFQITGRLPKIFRPPFGVYNEKHINLLSLKVILWSNTGVDWRQKNPKDIARSVVDNISPGDIILLHDIHAATAIALPIIIDELREKGYRFLKISELLNLESDQKIFFRKEFQQALNTVK